jgi:hypothetical protein
MTYVELNPIRAKMASTPEQSDFTSLKLRVTTALKGEQPKRLLPFIGNEQGHQPKGIAFSLQDYLKLVDETGRVIRDGKRGAISANVDKILSRLNIPAANWIKIITKFGQLFHGPVGILQELSCHCVHLAKRRWHFSNSCRYMQVD